MHTYRRAGTFEARVKPLERGARSAAQGRVLSGTENILPYTPGLCADRTVFEISPLAKALPKATSVAWRPRALEP